MTDISRDIKTLIETLESKNLSLTIQRNRFHVYNKRNDLIFIGTFEECSDWIEVISYCEDQITYMQPIELGFFDPIAKPDHQLRVYIFGILACLFFALGIFFQPAIGFAGIPAIVAAFYSFHKYKQNNKTKKQNEN